MIFLDNNSTTSLDPRVLEEMMPFLTEKYGNPHSNFHKFGMESRDAVEESREKISKIFNIDEENIIFTSGATEANNLFIKGAALFAQENNKAKKKIFCSSIEHKCVIESVLFCKSIGYEISFIPMKIDGTADLEWLDKNIDNSTLLVSLMAVNNETGLRTNLEDVINKCKQNDVIFHSDMAQALHGEKFDLSHLDINGISISGHKIYGPKGVGALICNDFPPNFLKPILDGGLQEQGVRSGTVPVFLTKGLSKALELVFDEHDKNKEHLLNLKQHFTENLNSLTKDIKPNFDIKNGHPGTLSIYFENVDANIICSRLANKVAISAAAACTGNKYEYSHVLKNMGLPEKVSRSSVRLCFGKDNTTSEALQASKIIFNEYDIIKNC